MKNIIQYLFILFSSVIVNTQVIALPTDQDQRMLLSANRTELDYRQNIGIYEGNVQLQQGSTLATADKMISHYDKKHKLENIQLIGHAHYQTQTELNEPMLYADADQIIFHPKKHQAILMGNAHVIQDKYEATGPYITYDTEKKTMQLTSNAKQRTVMVFTPTVK